MINTTQCFAYKATISSSNLDVTFVPITCLFQIVLLLCELPIDLPLLSFDIASAKQITSRFVTYFPHVDNIYSHRSTQRYKRKPFISHYWDCRLKGRPPGTPKSDDPNKKKRKRQARERDLCDVKIKITEYFPGARAQLGNEIVGPSMHSGGNENNLFATGPSGPNIHDSQQAPSFAAVNSHNSYRPNPPGSDGSRFYTIQRVNGNGANSKAEGIAGLHKHSLQDSDRVKKNSIQRHFLKEEKSKRQAQVSLFHTGGLFLNSYLPLKAARRYVSMHIARHNPSSWQVPSEQLLRKY